MQAFVKIDKVEAARRHLIAGVELFFDRRDPIVVHTVAFAAYQILSDLCAHRKVTREIEDSDVLKNLGVHQEFLRAFRKLHNFFKHADKDPDGFVKFFPNSNYVVLLLATEYYAKLISKVPKHCQVLRAWFFVKHPEHAPLGWAQMIRSHAVPSADDFEFFKMMLSSPISE